MTGLSTTLAASAGWRRDFRKMWAAETVSEFGNNVTGVALPLTAAALLQATPMEMGILTAAATLPTLLFSFHFGVLADRAPRRRPIMVWTDLLRMVLLGLIPVAAFAGFLSMGLLIVVAFAAGSAAVAFRVARSSYIPTLAPADNLVEVNSKLQGSTALATLVGPGVAGVLVGLVGGPNAVAIDAASFGLSAVLLGYIRHRENRPATDGERRSGAWREIAEGLRYYVDERRMRAIAGAAANLNLFIGLLLALIVLYMTRDLGMPPALLGLLFSAIGLGALSGAVLATSLRRWLSEERAVIAATAVFSVALFAYPAARGPVWLVFLAVALTNVLLGFAIMVFDVHIVALRQRITPDHLQGRATATMIFLTQGVKPLGALLGGALGEVIGLRGALWVAAAGATTTVLWVWFSPLRR